MAEFKLSDDQENKAIDMVLNLDPMDNVRKELGFKSRQKFAKYLADNPLFLSKIEAAKQLSCYYLEDDLLSCADKFNKEYARVKMEAIAKMLKFRDPKKYGDKLDMSVTHTIDIAGSLDRASKRMIDVTPINVLPILGNKPK